MQNSGKALFCHSGRVTSVSGNFVQVEVVPPRTCGSCAMKSNCGGAKTRVLKAVTDSPCQTGDQVRVEISNVQAWKALFFGIILPFLVTILGVVIGLQLSGNDTIAGAAGLLSVAFYYGLLYFFRSAAERSFIIKASPVPEA